MYGSVFIWGGVRIYGLPCKILLRSLVVSKGKVMKNTLKKNVAAFDSDVSENGGYRYTLNAPYSSIVSNRRLTQETVSIIRRLGESARTVIDIGCGDGTFTGELAHQLSGVAFTGFDPAVNAINSATGRYPSCEFAVGDILDPTTFPSQTYDLAVIRGVIHHLPTQRQAVENALQLSKRLLIIEPNGNNPILKVIEKRSKYHIEHEEQSFSSGFFLRIAKELNLEVAHLGFVGFVPFFFPTFPSKIIHFFQPLLEKIPLLPRYFGGQIILLLEQKSGS